MSEGKPESWQEVQGELERLHVSSESILQTEKESSHILTNGERSVGPSDPIEPSILPEIAKAVHTVDHALRDALCHGKNRAIVLQLETDVSWFVLENNEPQFVFTGDMSSYQRLLAHRVAQHWGLDTCIMHQGPDQGRILATRTARTGPPQIKLADVPISLAELTSWPTQQRYYQPVAGGSHATPRVLVRRRPDRMAPRRAAMPDLHGAGHRLHFSSPEDREMVYAQARARIFSGNMAAQRAASVVEAVAVRSGTPGEPTPTGGESDSARGPAEDLPESSAGGAEAVSGASSSVTGGTARKAQLRNKQEDLADPDFRGRRRSNQWADAGYGESAGLTPQSVHLQAMYSGEVPDLSGKPGSNSPYESPSHALYSANPYTTQMVAVSPYHVVPGQGIVGPPHLGGMTLYAPTGAGTGVQYGMPTSPAAYVPMPAYGFVPLPSRGEGDAMLAPGTYGVYGGPGMTPGMPGGAAFAIPAPGYAYAPGWQGMRAMGWQQSAYGAAGDLRQGGRGGGMHRWSRGGRSRQHGTGAPLSTASGFGRVFSMSESNGSTLSASNAVDAETPLTQRSATSPTGLEGEGEHDPPAFEEHPTQPSAVESELEVASTANPNPGP